MRYCTYGPRFQIGLRTIRCVDYNATYKSMSLISMVWNIWLLYSLICMQQVTLTPLEPAPQIQLIKIVSIYIKQSNRLLLLYGFVDSSVTTDPSARQRIRLTFYGSIRCRRKNVLPQDLITGIFRTRYRVAKVAETSKTLPKSHVVGLCYLGSLCLRHRKFVKSSSLNRGSRTT